MGLGLGLMFGSGFSRLVEIIRARVMATVRVRVRVRLRVGLRVGVTVREGVRVRDGVRVRAGARATVRVRLRVLSPGRDQERPSAPPRGWE